MEILVALFGILIVALILGGFIAGYAIVDGVVISLLWNWFAVPLSSACILSPSSRPWG